MKLYEVLKIFEADYDTYDDEYDSCVTVCYIDENNIEDSYDKFCINLMKKVEVERIIPDSHLVCKWSKLIQDNISKFRKFTLEYWHKDSQYDGDDEMDDFIFAWINEIHYYLAGYVSEDFYDTLVEFVDSLKA